MKTLRLTLSRLAAILGLFTLSSATTLAQPAALEVTTSFSILGDLVRQVGGDKVHVRALVGADEDAHAFQPRPSDARAIGASALVVVNGLGFDDWMTRLARSGGFKGQIVVASAGVNTLAMVLGIPLLKLALGLTGGAILIAVLMKYLPDSVLMRRVTNATVSGGPAGEAVNIARVQVGDRGNAVTELKPNGKAMIHGEICEVFSRQGILIKGTPVRVVDIRPFDLVVVRDESPSGD